MTMDNMGNAGNTDPKRAPLYEALAAHASLGARAFHVPGHKQRAGFSGEGADASFRALLPLDVTELADTDDLHHPQGPLAEAQRLAARCFRAEETSFLVGGSTSGNLAMILGSCVPGDLFIVQRNVHKSIIHGFMLAGAKAVLLAPELDPLSGLAVLPSEARIEAALSYYPEARGVILTAPNYYGMTASLGGIVALTHARGVPVLVDEAHGAHLGFHPAFPDSALAAGADVVVQSTHKMLSAMTMGAMLHLQGDRVDREAIKQALRMVQSSSPSFPILASLDLARRQLDAGGADTFAPALEAVRLATSRLAETPFRALGYGAYANASLRYDPLKLVLFDETGGLGGGALRDELAARGCVAEMADDRYVVLAFGPGSEAGDGEALRSALLDIARIADAASPAKPLSGVAAALEDPGGSPATAAAADVVPEPVTFRRGRLSVRPVPLADCEGLTAGEWVIPYPPGIPVLYPGEVITANTIRELERWKNSGAQIQGAADGTLTRLVVQDDEGN